jgi:hypothetical protein
VTRSIGSYAFQFVDWVRPSTDAAGTIVEYTHNLPASVRPNKYARGPFCRFRIGRALGGSGAYTIFVGDELKYVGECTDLSERFGPAG